MALLFCDGFDHYATADVLKKWSGYNTDLTIGAYGRFGSSGVRLGQYGVGGVYKTFTTGFATAIAGFAFYLPDVRSGISMFDLWATSLGEYHARICLDTLNRLYVANSAGTMIAGPASVALPLAAWSYIEIKVYVHNSDGTAEIRVNGQSVLSATGLDTRYGSTAGEGVINGVSLFYHNARNDNPYWQADDFYLCDSSGSTNNTFLGDVRVQSIFPSGAGNTTQMTPSAVSNYQCVDEAAPNADTDYVSETTAGEKDTYAFGNLTPTSGTVKGVRVMICARKDDAGSRSIAPVYRPASTDYDGTTGVVSDSYTYLSEIKEVSPETSAAWTIAEINGAEFGVKLIS